MTMTTLQRTPHPSIWWLILLQGVAGILLGLMLITAPGTTMVALVTFLGFYWLITGVLSLVQMFVDPVIPWFWSLLSGILGIAAGSRTSVIAAGGNPGFRGVVGAQEPPGGHLAAHL